MAISLLPLGTLGAVENNGTVTFGIWLPWVSAARRCSHRQDHPRARSIYEKLCRANFRSAKPASPMAIFGRPRYRSPAHAGNAGIGLGSPGRYVYRYRIDNPNAGSLDWIVDPFAREFGVGKLSAFTLGYQPYVWSTQEANWRTPALTDLILYEVNIAELAGDSNEHAISWPISAISA